MNDIQKNEANARNLIAVVFAIVFPTIVTLVYFKWLSNHSPSVQQSAYAIGKTIQFLFPVVWIWLFFRYRFSRERKKDSDSLLKPDGSTWFARLPNWLLSIGFGIDVCIVLAVAWFFFLSGNDAFGGLTAKLQEKISGLGIDQFWKYALLGVFYAVVHSFLEEYYWRWFVYDMLKRFVSISVANVISSLGFMAHHVILLSVYFGWDSPLTYVCSLSVAIGGVVWAWIYQRTGSLIWPWLSHAIVDAGLFSLGYFLVGKMFA
jgi:membrane protease YdiL (CAAX protease family)